MEPNLYINNTVITFGEQRTLTLLAFLCGNLWIQPFTIEGCGTSTLAMKLLFIVEGRNGIVTDLEKKGLIERDGNKIRIAPSAFDDPFFHPCLTKPHDFEHCFLLLDRMYEYGVRYENGISKLNDQNVKECVDWYLRTSMQQGCVIRDENGVYKHSDCSSVTICFAD